MPSFLLRRIFRKGRNHMNNSKCPGMSAAMGGTHDWQHPGKVPTNIAKGLVNKRLFCQSHKYGVKVGCIKSALDWLKIDINMTTAQGVTKPPAQQALLSKRWPWFTHSMCPMTGSQKNTAVGVVIMATVTPIPVRKRCRGGKTSFLPRAHTSK